MRFKRQERHEFTDTSRKRAAFERKKRIERESFPLFADQIAAEQISADDEMAGRRVIWERQSVADRQRRAGEWRKARDRIRAYPDPVRRALLTYWRDCKWPADPSYFLTMCHMYDNGRLELPAWS
jgi:hypothetical protein